MEDHKKSTDKEQHIKNCWVEIIGENGFENLGVDENGWSKGNTVFLHLIRRFDTGYQHPYSATNMVYRPKSLKGLEDNNGWSKLSLPRKSGLYHVELDNTMGVTRHTVLKFNNVDGRFRYLDNSDWLIRDLVLAWRLIEEPPIRLF